MSSQIHVNDTGTQLIFTIKEDDVAVDISSATDIVMTLRKPNAVSYEKVGVFYTDGTDGKVKYTAVSGDFDQAGTYKAQITVTLPDGEYHSSISDFKVYCNL